MVPRTLAANLAIETRSRRGLMTPPSHSRVGTISAMAIQALPPCTLALISSACTCCKSNCCVSTMCSCTRRRCSPDRRHHSFTVRSS